jgi:hypothetical protein
MHYKPIAQLMIPAIATTIGWVRTAKRITISTTTPVWMVRILEEYSRK